MYHVQMNPFKWELYPPPTLLRYACAAVNTVGAALARSHLVVFDPKDFKVWTNKG